MWLFFCDIFILLYFIFVPLSSSGWVTWCCHWLSSGSWGQTRNIQGQWMSLWFDAARSRSVGRLVCPWHIQNSSFTAQKHEITNHQRGIFPKFGFCTVPFGFVLQIFHCSSVFHFTWMPTEGLNAVIGWLRNGAYHPTGLIDNWTHKGTLDWLNEWNLTLHFIDFWKCKAVLAWPLELSAKLDQFSDGSQCHTQPIDGWS